MSKKKYRIEYDRPGCIGAAICEVFDPEDFEMKDDGKADLLDSEESEEKTDWYTKEMEFDLEDPKDKERFNKLKQAAEGCPVNVIHIIDLETKKRLI